MIEQFRHGTEEIILEIPGGMIDDDEDVEMARRELLEETEFSADNLILLGKSQPNPASQSNTKSHYRAVDRKTGEISVD